LESEFSGKILSILLEEQVKLLVGEIDERQKQFERVNVIKECICGKAIVPVNTIIDIEGIMKKRYKVRNKKKLTLIYIGVGIASALGILFMVWLVTSRIWWGLSLFLFVALIGLAISAFLQKDNVFVCPKCNSVLNHL